MHFKVILLASFFLTQSSFSATKLSRLNDRMNNQSNKITKLAAKIKDFDQRIGQNNNSFLDYAKIIESLEKEISIVKVDLEGSAKNISKEFNLTQKAFDLYLLEATESNEEFDIAQKTVHFELLGKKLKTLKQAQKKSRKNLISIQKLEQTLAGKKKEEQEIYALIMELENQKRILSEKYVNELEKKNRLQNKIEKAQARKIAKRKLKRKKISKVDFKLSLPILSFVDAQKNKNGIKFKYSETTPIKAPGDGKIAYVGELASYGKVMIIDHGKDVRSVLFGDIAAKVQKGKIVNHGQIVGYTMGEPGTVKSIYYEVRKKNKVQNTLSWLKTKELKSVKI